MREIKADEARRGLRDLLDEVARYPAVAIRILRYERPVAVLVSDLWYSDAVRILKVVEQAMAQADTAQDSFLAEAIREGLRNAGATRHETETKGNDR
jgi:hypothetical protein